MCDETFVVEHMFFCHIYYNFSVKWELELLLTYYGFYSNFLFYRTRRCC